VALVGIAGSGKSAVARRLADELGGSCISLDASIAESTGRSIAELFAAEGEARFREREAEALARAVSNGPAVIDCGGGVVLDPRNRALLKNRCMAIWLEVAPAEALRRIGDQVATRPLLVSGPAEAALTRQLAERSAYYEEVASWRVRTDGHEVGEVALDICRHLEDRA